MHMFKKLWNRICFWKETPKDTSSSPDIYQNIARIYLKNDLINSGFIPDILEIRVYAWIIEKIFSILQDRLQNQKTNVFDGELCMKV